MLLRFRRLGDTLLFRRVKAHGVDGLCFFFLLLVVVVVVVVVRKTLIEA